MGKVLKFAEGKKHQTVCRIVRDAQDMAAHCGMQSVQVIANAFNDPEWVEFYETEANQAAFLFAFLISFVNGQMDAIECSLEGFMTREQLETKFLDAMKLEFEARKSQQREE